MKRLLLILAFILLPVLSNADLKPVLPTDDLQAMLRLAVPGDVFVVEDSVRLGGIYITGRSGTADAPIVLRALNPGKAVIRGFTATRTDNLSLNSCHNWRIEGMVFEQSNRAGLYLGKCNSVVVKNCISRNQLTQGMLVSGNDHTIEDNQVYQIEKEHCVYSTGANVNTIIRNNKFSYCGKSQIQLNNQGSGGVSRNALIEGNSCWNGGLQAAGANSINLIGVVQSKIQNNTIHDNVGGIALSGGATGNLIYGNIITYRAGTGRACISASDSIPTTNSAVGNILRMGRTTTGPIVTNNAAVIVQTDNTVLPVATKTLPVPNEVIAGPVP